MRHLAWERHGRRFVHDDEGKPGTFTWRSKIGCVNVDVNGDGQTFAPYHLSGDSLRHGESACEFSDGWQTLKRLGQTLVSKSRLYVQRNVSGTWTDVPHGIPTRNVLDNTPTDGRCTASLDFPNIQGYASGARLQVGIEVGGNDKQIYGFRFRSPVAGTFRLEWTFEIPEQAELSWIEEPVSPENPEPIRVGGRIGSTSIRWRRAEAPYRSATVETVAGGRILHLFLGPYTVAALEWLTIYPDTWGADVGIAATADDGFDDAEVVWDATNVICGYDPTYLYHPGLRWTGITCSGTIDTTYIDLYEYNYGGSAGNLTTNWYAWDADNAGQFGGANRPSTVTKTTAAVQMIFNPDTYYESVLRSPNLKTIVQELVDSYGISSEAINFILLASSPGVYRRALFEDYQAAGTQEAELTITYTPAAGGKATKNTRSHPLGIVLGEGMQMADYA